MNTKKATLPEKSYTDTLLLMTSPILKRTLSLPQMVLYGLGTTIGAGIYALVGEIAGIAGLLAPFSFLIASLLASVTALSFAELSARFPQAAGAALYTQKAFSSSSLAVVIGLMVCLAGIVSSAALINGFIGYLQLYIHLERTILIGLITLFIGGLAIWGIAESVTVAGIITLIEIGGLLSIIFVCRDAYPTLPAHLPAMLPSMDKQSWIAISSGTILAFYAFIGFEDMVEVAEEVKNVKRTLPIAILLTIFISSIVYLLIMVAAVLILPTSTLAQSEAPLTLLYETQTGKNSNLLNIIGMIAVINGAIIQMIMSSRVLYGLSSRNQLPKIFSRINARTQTPVFATLFVTLAVLILAITGRLASLAQLTSLIVLVTFSIVNLSLWRIKQKSAISENFINTPVFLPLTGFIVCLALILTELLEMIL